MNTAIRYAHVTPPIDERHRFVNLIGGNSPYAPGWYIENTVDGRIGLCVGPFDSLETLTYQWEQSKRRYPLYGFVAQSALLMEQVVALRTSSVYLGERSRIDDFVKLEGGEGIVVGAHVHIASFCHINIGGGLTLLGEGSAFSSGAKIHSGTNLPDRPSMSATAPVHLQTIVRKQTVIGRNAAVLAGAQVLSGLTVGEGARIGAGAVVCDDVPAFELWTGGKAFARKNLQTGERLDKRFTTTTTVVGHGDSGSAVAVPGPSGGTQCDIKERS